MRFKNLKIVTLVFIFVMLNGCSFYHTAYVKSKGGNLESFGRETILPQYIPPKNCKVLFKHWNQRFVVYNLSLKKEIKELMGGNYFGYSFKVKSDYYTVGDSYTNGFSIVKCDGERIKEIYRLKDQKWQAIFPLATDGKKIFFIVGYYKPAIGHNINEKYRIIARWDYKNKKLIEYRYTKGAICDGTIIGKFLYYTSYDFEKEKYEIYKLNIANAKNKPQLIGKFEKLMGLYNINEELYIWNGKEFFCFSKPVEKIYFNKAFDVIYIGNNNILVFYTDSFARIAADIIDVKSRIVKKTFTNIVAVNFEGDQVVIYGDGYIEKF
ncbi:hypothetical protein [Anaerocellum danielii]|uniref:Lipoprotein n=1 Tax=Anaerocellum danielii TaxID=1387557 RepID=A0ABZ0U4P8_9FIRM|nr:hypothetical protein [Caldicellulosiruptor danielii]WPX09449.1 hypothetical protein SOJ16_000658 [Caldicellulosiruptor danielii]